MTLQKLPFIPLVRPRMYGTLVSFSETFFSFYIQSFCERPRVKVLNRRTEDAINAEERHLSPCRWMIKLCVCVCLWAAGCLSLYSLPCWPALTLLFGSLYWPHQTFLLFLFKSLEHHLRSCLPLISQKVDSTSPDEELLPWQHHWPWGERELTSCTCAHNATSLVIFRREDASAHHLSTQQTYQTSEWCLVSDCVRITSILMDKHVKKWHHHEQPHPCASAPGHFHLPASLD